MNIGEIEKEKVYITVEIIEYVPNSVVVKTILKKSSGNISVVSADHGEGLTEKSSPYDTFVQLIDGSIELMIGGKSNMMQSGQSIIIPANVSNYVKPSGRFKMIVTVINSEND